MSAGVAPPPYCAYCGKPLGAAEHAGCAKRAAFDPPRYCAHCARRMVVQVTPAGWSARCVEHGTTASQLPG